MKFLTISAGLLALTFSSGTPANAQQAVQILKTCDLTETLRLETDTVIVCDDTFHSESTGRIITQGFRLRLTADNTLDLTQPLKIRAYDEASSRSPKIDAAEITISARACIGSLNIDNRGQTNEGLGGDVTVECLTSLDYDQAIDPGASATVTFIRNGDRVPLAGTLYKPAR